MAKETSRQSNSTVFIIFGGTGDLSKRKIFPALFNLFLENRLPGKFAIIGTARSKMGDSKYKTEILEAINEFSRRGKAKKEDWTKFASYISYQPANFKEIQDYKAFDTRLTSIKENWKEDP